MIPCLSGYVRYDLVMFLLSQMSKCKNDVQNSVYYRDHTHLKSLMFEVFLNIIKHVSLTKMDVNSFAHVFL